jgi:PST family polysaccharide transporter
MPELAAAKDLATNQVMEGAAPERLTEAAVRGVTWHGASYLLGKLLVFASTIVLARLLVPADFGVVGLALVFIAYADVVSDLGISQAIVYLPADRRRNDTALTSCLAFGASMVLAAQVAAPFAARFFHDGEVTTLFRVLSLTLLLGAAAQVPDALLRKQLDFRRRMLTDLGRAVGRGGVAIALAAAGFGPWSIVIGELAGDVVYGAVAWKLVDYRPHLGFWRVGRDDVGALLRFGGPAAASVFVANLIFDIDYLIVGARLGTRALGFYTLAFRLPEMAIINVFFVLSAVAFPIFSRARDDPDRLRRGYVKSVRLQSLYGVAAGVGMAMVAPTMIRVLFGAKWVPSVVPLQALALYAAFRSLGVGANDVYKAIGRPGLALWLALVRLGVLAPTLLIASHWGIRGVAWAQAGVALVFAVAMQALAASVLGVPLRALIGAVRPALVAGAAIVAGVAAARTLVAGDDWMRLVLGVVAGAVTVALALGALERPVVRELRQLARRTDAA